MTIIVTTFSKYIMLLLFAIYTFQSFHVFKKKNEEERRHIYSAQTFVIFALSFFAHMVLYLHSRDFMLLFYYVAQIAFFVAILSALPLLYPGMSRLLLNHMCMLMSIGFFMLARLDMNKSVKQFLITAAAVVVSLLIPVIIRKARFLMHLKYFYGLLGIGLLAFVLLSGSVTFGSKINITIGESLTVAPIELVKIVFVFFVAAMLYKDNSFSRVVHTTVLAAVHILILVLSKDLGAALILFIVYMAMLFVATRKASYLFGGLFCFSAAAVVAFFLFHHVRVRVLTWTTAFDVIKNDSSQVAQSLFAIGTGGWFGSGLGEGLPNTIPVSLSDFIFSAIAEELGTLFAICLFLICISCFLMFVNISLQIQHDFYQLVAFGLSVSFIFQVVLNIGGDTKFIPLTGVTLPFVSYGGTSVLSSVVVFFIIQSLYIMKQNEGVHNDD